MRLRVLFTMSLVATLVACGRNGISPSNAGLSPVAPSVRAAALDASSAGAAGRDEVHVTIQDACDPETFSAQSVSCVREGGVTFEDFIGKLAKFGFIAPWRFAPEKPNVRAGQTFVASNIGGEVHTFTQVAEFGGGFVQPLNDVLHLPTMAPECDLSVLEAEDFVAPGGTYREEIEHTGTLKFQCCIHPWMRLEASSR